MSNDSLMSRSRVSIAALIVMALAGCGPTHNLPVSVSQCAIVAKDGTVALRALVRNAGEKPIGSVDLQADIYRDFRFARFSATPTFTPVLDPGTTREILEPVSHGTRTGSLHCSVTKITYGDGTTDQSPS